jgi:hypothetical protein
MDLTEIGLGSVDWIQLAQDRDRWRALVNTVMNLRVLAPRSLLIDTNSMEEIHSSEADSRPASQETRRLF